MTKNRKPSEITNCLSCGVDITKLHFQHIRCLSCSKNARREYFRLYMAKKWLRDKQKRRNEYTSNDLLLISRNHMTGLGTFELPTFTEDFIKEAEAIRALKRYLRLH